MLPFSVADLQHCLDSIPMRLSKHAMGSGTQLGMPMQSQMHMSMPVTAQAMHIAHALMQQSHSSQQVPGLQFTGAKTLMGGSGKGICKCDLRRRLAYICSSSPRGCGAKPNRKKRGQT